MSEKSLEQLAEEFWSAVRRMRQHPGPKKNTRFRKEVMAEIAAISLQVIELRPGNHPLALMETMRPDDMEPYYAHPVPNTE